MSSTVKETRAFESGAALEPFRIVKLAAGVLQYAGVNDEAIGVTADRSTAAAQDQNVNLRGVYPGTQIVTAADSFAVGATLYQAANGKVSDSGGGKRIGIALQAASGDGSQVEALLFWDKHVFTGRHTVSAGEDTANQADVDTGAGVALTGVVAQLRTAAGVDRDTAAASTTTILTGGDVGKFRLANANMAATDTIDYVAFI